MDAVEKLDEFDRFDVEAGFLADFADGASGERLAELEHSAGKRPVALERLGAPTDQKHAAVVDDDRADADERRLRVLAFNAGVDAAGHVAVEAISQFCHGAGVVASQKADRGESLASRYHQIGTKGRKDG